MYMYLFVYTFEAKAYKVLKLNFSNFVGQVCLRKKGQVCSKNKYTHNALMHFILFNVNNYHHLLSKDDPQKIDHRIQLGISCPNKRNQPHKNLHAFFFTILP